MRRTLLPLLSLPLFLNACGSNSAAPAVVVRLVDKAVRTTHAARPMSAVQGLYFGELEIVGYDYRPGESVQTNPGFGNGTNWSYWVVLQSGHPSARDILLKDSGRIDITALNGEYGRQEFDENFVGQVGSFELDFLEVNFYRTGVVVGGEYYGYNAELNGLSTHPLHRYSALSTIADHFTQPFYPGFSTTVAQQGQSHSALLARNDWFPAGAVAEFDNEGNLTHSNPALDVTQEEILESLIKEGTTRRFYDQVILVPYEGPAGIPLAPDKVVDVGTTEATQENSNPDDGGTAPAPTSGSAQAEITVGFDLSDVLGAATDIGNKVIHYKGDANHVPFGLTVEVKSAETAAQ